MGIKINFATGFEIPPYFLKNKEIIISRINDANAGSDRVTAMGAASDEELRQQVLGVRHFDEVKIKLETEADIEENWYMLPVDPVISVVGRNQITRRNVLKTNEYVAHRGTVKEIWSQDDYEVNIAGSLVAHKFPENNLRILKNICEARQAVDIKSQLLGLFGITRVTIEDYSFPFTKGLENQMYTIKAYSDDRFDLLVMT
ncbi:MAG: DUF6046 domain-containing protein [Prevotellaceae bacterium]|jgi:hypothetical protein|nr:DUF6046 domain-containing protein [Prevotellaceae bacterium]